MLNRNNLIFLILNFVFLQLSAQDFFDLHPEIPEFIKGIDNSLNQLEKVTLTNDEFVENVPDGGAELTSYTKNSQLVKIELWAGLSYGIERRDFYFRNGELYFIQEYFDQFNYDDEKGEWDRSETNMSYRGRYLFKEEFDLMTLGHHLFDEEVDDRERLEEELARYVNILKERTQGNNR